MDPARASKTAVIVTVKVSLFAPELKLRSTLLLNMKAICLPLGSSGEVSLPRLVAGNVTLFHQPG